MIFRPVTTTEKGRSPFPWPRTFSSLRHRNYLLLWVGTLISNSGDWMDQVALNWLVLVMTNSPFYLALLNFSRSIPLLIFTWVGGVAADRFERRKLLMVTQGSATVLALMLAALVSLGWAQLWQLILISVLRGVMTSFNQPARQALIPDLVGKGDLMNAVVLNSATMNATRIIGPALGGILIGIAGVAACFWVNAISFVAVLWALYAMRIGEDKLPKVGRGVREDLNQVIDYVRSHPIILALLLIALIPMIFGQPYSTLLPLFARDILGIGAAGLGFLQAASATGALVGALIVASLGEFRRKGVLMLGSMFLFGAALLLFSFSASPALSFAFLIMAGMGHMGYRASNNTLLQMLAPRELRGRILSLLLLDRGLVPLGTMLAGVLATFWGASIALSGMASIVLILALLVALTMPRMRRLG